MILNVILRGAGHVKDIKKESQDKVSNIYDGHKVGIPSCKPKPRDKATRGKLLYGSSQPPQK